MKIQTKLKNGEINYRPRKADDLFANKYLGKHARLQWLQSDQELVMKKMDEENYQYNNKCHV